MLWAAKNYWGNRMHHGVTFIYIYTHTHTHTLKHVMVVGLDFCFPDDSALWKSWIFPRASVSLPFDTMFPVGNYVCMQFHYPITGLERPSGIQELDASRIFRQPAHECGEVVVSPTHRPPLPPEDTRSHSVDRRIMSIKNPYKLCRVPVCSAMSQPNLPPVPPILFKERNHVRALFWHEIVWSNLTQPMCVYCMIFTVNRVYIRKRH
jgi:hypothetical protein